MGKIKIMKRLLLVLFLFHSFIGFSQIISKTLSEKKIGSLNCKNLETINLPTNDTTYEIRCTFQNQQYQHITDIGSVSFHSELKNDLDEIISQLKECIKYMDDKSYSFSIGQFRISDKFKILWISNYDDTKYTTLSKKNVLKWIKWLEECTFIK